MIGLSRRYILCLLDVCFFLAQRGEYSTNQTARAALHKGNNQLLVLLGWEEGCAELLEKKTYSRSHFYPSGLFPKRLPVPALGGAPWGLKPWGGTPWGLPICWFGGIPPGLTAFGGMFWGGTPIGLGLPPILFGGPLGLGTPMLGFPMFGLLFMGLGYPPIMFGLPPCDGGLTLPPPCMFL